MRKEFTQNYLSEIIKCIDLMKEFLPDRIDEIAKIFSVARDTGKKIFFMGNGGSGSTASHFACDLAKGTISTKYPRFKAISLTDNIPVILAWANDDSYEVIFVEQLKNLFEPEDVVVGISGSGNSPNVLRAIEYANKNGGITIGLSGFDGGKLKDIVQVSIVVPAYNMQQIEDMHLLIEHILTSLFREYKSS